MGADLGLLFPQTRSIVEALARALAERGLIVPAIVPASSLTEVAITSTWRSFEKQAEIYASGRDGRGGPILTKAPPGSSFHEVRRAVDFAVDLRPGLGEKPAWPDRHPLWTALDELAPRFNLTCGPTWDKPHVEDRWCSECRRMHDHALRRAMRVAHLAQTFRADGSCALRAA